MGKGAEAVQSVAEFERRFPKNPTVGFAGLPVWAALSNWDSVAVQAERARRSSQAQNQSQGVGYLYVLALVQGRLHDATKLLAEWERIDSLRGLPHDPLTSQLTAAALEIRLLDRPADAIKRLDSLVAVPSLRGRESRTIAVSYAEANAPDKARKFLNQFEADTRDTSQLRVESSLHHLAVGQVDIAEKKYDAGIAELWASDTLYDGAPVSCESCALPALARAYDLAGKTDQAIAMLERYAHNTYAFRFANTDPFYLTPTFERLAQLYEQKGDREKAITYYRKFIDLWKGADPELQPRVADAKKRLAALTASEKR